MDEDEMVIRVKIVDRVLCFINVAFSLRISFCYCTACLTITGHNESNRKSGRGGLSDCRLIDYKNGTELVLTYKDKDGDWMLAGDVSWRMFTGSCKRVRIMKGSDAMGLGWFSTREIMGFAR